MRAAERHGEGSLAADGYLRSLGTADGPLSALSPEGVGATHVAVYATLTRVFDRYGSLVMAGRELFMVATIASALLLWRTARRLGLGDPAAAVAVVLAGLPALLPPLALVDVPAALAVPWLLLAGFLTVSGRSTRAARIGAVLAGTVAVLLAPVVLLLALSAAVASLVLGRAPLPGPRTLRTTAALLLGAGFLTGAVLLRGWKGAVGTAGLPDVPDGVPGGVAAAYLAIGCLAAWRLPALRSGAVALVATTLATLASALLLDVLLVCLPAAGALAGALLQDLLDAAPARPGTATRSTASVVRVGAVVILGGVCVAAALSWPDAQARPTGRVPTALLAWADDELPDGAHLLVPRRLRAELLHAGADADAVLPPGAPAGADPSAPVLTVAEGEPPDGAAVLARFEGGEAPIALVDPAPGTPTGEELQRRHSLAAAILANPRTSTGEQAAGVLRSAAVDQRLLSVLAALTARSGIGIAAFPAPPAAPDDGLPARRALLDSAGGEELRPAGAATDGLVTWLEAQRGPFAPDSVEVTDRGVLIGYRYVSDPDALVTRSAP